MRNIQALIIGAIVIAALSSAGLSLISLTAQNNEHILANASEDWQALNNTFSEINSGISEISGKVNGTLAETTEEGEYGFFDVLVKSVTNSLKTVGRSMVFLTRFFVHISSFLPAVPTWVGTLISSLIILIVGFAIWKAIFKVP